MLTPAEHAALSADLARALGWQRVEISRQPDIADNDPVCFVALSARGFRRFDYRDPTVCLPLIEWLGAKHQRAVWCAESTKRWRAGGDLMGYDTLPEAVARAVIALKTTGA